MKKITAYLLVLVLTPLTIGAQDLEIDTEFGVNGTFRHELLDSQAQTGLLILNGDALLIYAQSRASNSSIYENIIIKIFNDGTIDSSFADNGVLTLPDYPGNFSVKTQNSNSFLVRFDSTSSSSNTNQSVLKYTNTGQPDINFASNGELLIPGNGSSSSNLIILNDESFLVSDTDEIYKFDVNGNPDLTYGTNGVVNVSLNRFLDITENNSFFTLSSTGINKKDVNGNPILSFDGDGTFNFPVDFQSDYTGILTQNNTILCLNIGGPSNNLYKMNTDGVLDMNFNNQGIVDLNNNDQTLIQFFDITLFNGLFFIMGDTTTPEPFLISYNSSGELVQINGNDSYVETSIDDLFYDNITGTENALYANGISFENDTNNLVIVKYSQPSLSTENTLTNSTAINYSNPVKNKLILNTNKALEKIEIYNLNGSLITSVNKTNTIDTQNLSSGVYIMRAYPKGNPSVVRKIIKQ